MIPSSPPPAPASATSRRGLRMPQGRVRKGGKAAGCHPLTAQSEQSGQVVRFHGCWTGPLVRSTAQVRHPRDRLRPPDRPPSAGQQRRPTSTRGLMALGFAPVRANYEISRFRCKFVAKYWVKTGVILSSLTNDLSLSKADGFPVAGPATRRAAGRGRRRQVDSCDGGGVLPNPRIDDLHGGYSRFHYNKNSHPRPEA